MWIQHYFFFKKIYTFCFTQQSPEKTKGTLCSHTLFPCLATEDVGKFSSRHAEAHSNLVSMTCLTFHLTTP